jgi:hypothetical protein
VFSGLSNPGLSRKIARYVGVTLGRADFTLCSNGAYKLDLKGQ